MNERLFGTDGVRGTANIPPMTPETALALGRAVATLFGVGDGAPARKGRTRILIGKDTRISGYLFETALASGVCSMGADVLLVGPLPTPGIAYLTVSMRADAGAVISASHNPFEDNGIKFFGRDGFKLPDAMEDRIEALVRDPGLLPRPATGQAIGKAWRIEDAAGRYCVALKSQIPRDLRLDGLRIVIDCANGAAYRVAPMVFRELGATVIEIYCAPDGSNINDGCGALYPATMGRVVVEEGADLGLALDGDADRAILCDARGQVVDGDGVLAICATWMHERGLLRGGGVVGTLMSNLGLERALERLGLHLVRTDVGDRHVVETMLRDGYNLGGEQSGHLVFLDHSTTGDGILTCLKVLEVMLRTGRPLADLASVFQRCPQVLMSARVLSRPPIESLPRVQAAIRHAEAVLERQGRINVRYSGTSAAIRVMIEGDDEARIRALAEDVLAAAAEDGILA